MLIDTLTNTIAIPDLSSYCENRFPLHISRYRKDISAESKEWFFYTDKSSTEKQEAYNGLNPGLLVSVCYPHGGFPQLRVVTDFLTYLFYFDNITDEMHNTTIRQISDIVMNSFHYPCSFQTSHRIGQMGKDFYKRMIKTASPGCQGRFLETFEQFLQSVDQQARDRIAGRIPTLEAYVALRRDTSGCKPCWAMIEYAYNLDIPDEVLEHPIIRSLESAANDLVSWSNDIFSYNREQSKGDTHNMVKVLMHEEGISVQQAVDRVSALCRQSIDNFVRDRERLPSWGDCIDRSVEKYVDGLGSWIVGILYWSFKTERYFGKDCERIKANWRVRLITSVERG